MLNRITTTRREILNCFLTPLFLGDAGAAFGAADKGGFKDAFDRRNDAWTPVTGQWSWGKGVVEQTELKRQIAILALNRETPAAYQARTRLKLIEGPTFRSAGLVFGYQDPDNYAGVYITSVDFATENFGPKVQMFYRERGRDHYPPARISYPAKNGTWYDLAIGVQAAKLRVSVNEKPVLAYALPPVTGRRAGLFAFDVHALFDQFQIKW